MIKMSANLPLEIEAEIMKRLPVKSLIQFRSVTKQWKSLIDGSDFIKHYRGQMHHLLVVTCGDITIVDDAYMFPQHKLSVTVPLLTSMLRSSYTFGSSQGLLCLYGYYHCDTKMAVVWNVSIRKAVAVVVPKVREFIYETVVGFGVCRETSDPKIVKITYITSWEDMESISSIPWQVEVFTLSIGAWRTPYRSNLPRKSLHFGLDRNTVVVDGVLYWVAADRVVVDGEFDCCNMIISFDMTREEFREVNLPNSLAHRALSIYKLRESLALLGRDIKDVWIMEDGVSKSFTKLFTINVNAPHASVMGFTKSGEPIIEISEDGHKTSKLVVYEPYSKRMDDVGIFGTRCITHVCPFVETLLLLDQSNITVYDETKTIRLPRSYVSGNGINGAVES